MATFEQLFPTFLQKCAELHELLRIVAFMLFIVGTILFVAHGFNGKTLMLHMVRLFVLTALLVMLPQLVTKPLTVFGWPIATVSQFYVTARQAVKVTGHTAVAVFVTF